MNKFELFESQQSNQKTDISPSENFLKVLRVSERFTAFLAIVNNVT